MKVKKWEVGGINNMHYSKSQLDKDNFEWFRSDKSRNTLQKIKISNGRIRGISSMEMAFEYPITAIVGENGSGKSTLLALITCAFHNTSSFIPQNRIRLNVKKPRHYYTYGDFFTFSPNEEGINEIEISSTYLSSNGTRTDVRKKKPSGKWNDFNSRPVRTVTYMGINRILPPSESNPHRHYSKYFQKDSLTDEQINQIKTSMSRILGKNYNDIELLSYNTYRLFEVHRNSIVYTGFNMGAGENAVLYLLLEVLSAGAGSLLVIDEIELGLHVQAQKKLVEELKYICKKYKCQIICSTHSKHILDQLPPEGRIFIKNADTATEIIPQISSQYAFGKLSGDSSKELDIFVEDDVGRAFLLSCLPQNFRERVNIIPVGSDQSVLKHMAVHYREERHNYIAFLDGDKRTQIASSKNKVKSHLETRLNETEDEFNEYIEKRLKYIPGDKWPEYVMVESALRLSDKEYLIQEWESTEEDITSYFEIALTAGKHKEFFTLAHSLALDIDQVRHDVMRFYKLTHQEQINDILNSIRILLE